MVIGNGKPSATPAPRLTLEAARREYIAYALEKTGHDLDRTARLLTVSVQELQRLMRKLGIK